MWHYGSMQWTKATIKTERLTLRALIEDDKPFLRQLMTCSKVRLFLGGPVSDVQLESLTSAVVGDEWGVFCITLAESNEPLGICTLERDRGELEVSFQLLPEYWRRGFAREAVTATMNWAWSNTDDRSVIGVTQTANATSCRLLRDLGFLEEATFEEYGATQARFRRTRPPGSIEGTRDPFSPMASDS